MEVAGPLGTPLGLAQRKRASPRGEAGTSGFLCVSVSSSPGSRDAGLRHEHLFTSNWARFPPLSPDRPLPCLTVASLSVLFLLRTSEQFTGYTHHSQALIRLVGERKLVFTLSEWEVLARGLTMQPEQASQATYCML